MSYDNLPKNVMSLTLFLNRSHHTSQKQIDTELSLDYSHLKMNQTSEKKEMIHRLVIL